MHRVHTHSSWLLVAAVLAVADYASGSTPTYVTEVRFGIIDPPVILQADITVRAPMSNQQPEPAPLECSGMAWADGALLIASDRHSHAFFVAPVDLEMMTVTPPKPMVIIRNEQDLVEDAEAMTMKSASDGRSQVYVTSSLSNDRSELALPKRQHMLRFDLLPGETPGSAMPVIIDMYSIREVVSSYFEQTGIEPYRTYYQEFTGKNKNTYRWGNVEGIAFTPDGSALLCGMRNPLAGEQAIFFVLKDIDVAFDERAPERIKVTDMFTLPMGGRGVSDLCWDPITEGYLITGATSNGPRISEDQPWPPNELDSALFWWSGRKTEPPVLVATFPDMKIEAVCRLGKSRFIAIGSDEADVSEGRTRQQQSILTIMYFTPLELRRAGGI